jgi:hypothetical protein
MEPEASSIKSVLGSLAPAFIADVNTLKPAIAINSDARKLRILLVLVRVNKTIIRGSKIDIDLACKSYVCKYGVRKIDIH